MHTKHPAKYEPLDLGDIKHIMSALVYEDRITSGSTLEELSMIANDFLEMLKQNKEDADPKNVMTALKELQNEIRREDEEDEAN